MRAQGPFEFEVGQRTQLGGGGSTIVGRSAGAFGAIYVLESDEGKHVAVKTPRLDLSFDDSVFGRFREEGLVWIDLPFHPCVLQARRILAHQGRPYIEMEYVPPINDSGSSIAALLAELPEEGVLNPSAVWTTAVHLINALAHIELHDSTFVHGDVKPANLLLKLRPESAGSRISDVGTEDVMVLLSDFGMSRAAGASLNDDRLGDVNYLAPEALETHQGSPRSIHGYSTALDTKVADVYAVGCTIFELLFNHPRQLLDQEAGLLVFALSRYLDPSQLMSLRPDLDLPFAELVTSCLDPNPARRPQTYADLQAVLLEATERTGAESKFLAQNPERTVRAKDAPFGRYLMDRHGLSEDQAREFLYLMLRSASLQSLGEVSKAAELLDEADRMVPNLASVENGRASGYLALQESERAKSHLRRAVSGYESDPELADAEPGGYSAACANLAQVLSSPRRRDPEAALSLAEIAVALNPDNARVQLSRGMALMSAGRLLDAGQAFRLAESLDPSNSRITTMGRCCELLQAAMNLGGPSSPSMEVSRGRPLSDENERLASELMEAYAAALAVDWRGE